MKKIFYIILCLIYFTLSYVSESQENKSVYDRHGRLVLPVIDPERGTVKEIAGFKEHIKNYGLKREDLNNETVKDLAKKIIQDYSDISKVKLENLKLKQLNHPGNLRWIIEFQQYYKNIPIENTSIRFGIGRNGSIDGILFCSYKISDLSINPNIDSEKSKSIALIHSYSTDTLKIHSLFQKKAMPELIIYPKKNDSSFVFYLAWKIQIYSLIYYINAQDGQIIDAIDNTINSPPKKFDGDESSDYKKNKSSVGPKSPTSTITSGIYGKIKGFYKNRYKNDLWCTNPIGYETWYIDVSCLDEDLGVDDPDYFDSDEDGNYSVYYQSDGEDQIPLFAGPYEVKIDMYNGNGIIMKRIDNSDCSVVNPLYENLSISNTVNYNGSSTEQNFTWDKNNSIQADASNIQWHLKQIKPYFESTPYNFIFTQIPIATVNEGYCVQNGAGADGHMIKFGTHNVELGIIRPARSSEVIYHEFTHNIIFSLYGNQWPHSIDPVTEALALNEGLSYYFPVAKWCSTPYATCDSRFASDLYGDDMNLFNSYRKGEEQSLPDPTNPHYIGLIIGGAAWDLRNGISGFTDGLFINSDKLIYQTLAHEDRPTRFFPFLKTLYKVDTDINDQLYHFKIQQAFNRHGIYSVSSLANLGWNMLSVPIDLYNGEFAPSQVWPEADQTKILKYNPIQEKYVLEGLRIDLGVGYFVRFSDLGVHPISQISRTMKELSYVGNELEQIVIPVSNGWNLIGSVQYLLNRSKVTLSSGVSFLSDFFRYEPGGYIPINNLPEEVKDCLEPGYGYWIKVSGTGNLTLDYNSTGSDQQPPGDQQPPPAPSTPPATPILVAPSNGATNQSINPTLSWNASTGATSYRLQVATNQTFTSVVFDDLTITAIYKMVTGLSYSTTYYWRINASNSYGTSSWSEIRNFQTGSAPPPDPDPCLELTSLSMLDQFIVSDAKDKKQHIFVRNGGRKIKSGLIVGDEMPPPSPDEYFDVRFKSNKFIEAIKHEDGNKKIYIDVNNAEFPITLWWSLDRNNLISYSLKLKGENDKEPISLTGSNKISISGNKNKEILLEATVSSPPPCEEQGSIFNNPNKIESQKVVNYSLKQNHPNPFNPITQFNYELPNDEYVSLKIFDVLGRVVATVVEQHETAGYKSVTFDASSLPSGLYFYRLQAGKFSDIKKMMLLK